MIKVKFISIISFLFITTSLCYGIDYSFAGYYRNFKVLHDYGLSYELTYEKCGYECSSIGNDETVYEAGDNGYGIASQYSMGVGLLMLNNRPAIGIGIIGEIQLIYSGESSFFSSGIGLEGKMLWFFSFFVLFENYSYFHKEVPVVEEYDYQNDKGPVLKKESINGGGFLFGYGLNIPVAKSYDLIFQFVIHELNKSSYKGDWSRTSVRFGLCYIY